jgi:hypothetical protein
MKTHSQSLIVSLLACMSFSRLIRLAVSRYVGLLASLSVIQVKGKGQSRPCVSLCNTP